MTDYTVMTPKTNVQVTYQEPVEAIAAARCLSAYLNNLTIDVMKAGKPWAKVYQSRVHCRPFVSYVS